MAVRAQRSLFKIIIMTTLNLRGSYSLTAAAAPPPHARTARRAKFGRISRSHLLYLGLVTAPRPGHVTHCSRAVL